MTSIDYVVYHDSDVCHGSSDVHHPGKTDPSIDCDILVVGNDHANDYVNTNADVPVYLDFYLNGRVNVIASEVLAISLTLHCRFVAILLL